VKLHANSLSRQYECSIFFAALPHCSTANHVSSEFFAANAHSEKAEFTQWAQSRLAAAQRQAQFGGGLNVGFHPRWMDGSRLQRMSAIRH
jgi:hypothetical protein